MTEPLPDKQTPICPICNSPMPFNPGLHVGDTFVLWNSRLLFTTPLHAKTFKLLYDKRGDLVRDAEIYNELYQNPDDSPSSNVICVIISRIRKVLYTNSIPINILRHQNVGYRLVLTSSKTWNSPHPYNHRAKQGQTP